jgi:PKD domain-containing protein/galactose oxidase-like protein
VTNRPRSRGALTASTFATIFLLLATASNGQHAAPLPTRAQPAALLPTLPTPLPEAGRARVDTAAGVGLSGTQTSGAEETLIPGWANITPGTVPPPPRIGSSIVFDPVDGYDLMFGGEGPTAPMGDTWIFEQSVWRELSPAVAPPARDHFAMVWDPAGPYVLLFGGAAPGTTFNDTWTFLHGEWTELSEPVHPSARWGTSITWDSRDNLALLFGGCASGWPLNDTWAFKDGVWSQLHPSQSPSPREDAALGYNLHDNQTVLFGGDDYNDTIYGDTWIFSSGEWIELSHAASPGLLTYASVAYDPVVNSVILFGGYNETPTQGTWWFSNGTWTELPYDQPPSPRYLAPMAMDGNDSGLILFSGGGPQGLLGDTWEYYNLSLSPLLSISSSDPLQVSLSMIVSGYRGQLRCDWSLGDGTSSAEPTLTHTFSAQGSYTITASATDSDGSTETVTFLLSVGMEHSVPQAPGEYSLSTLVVSDVIAAAIASVVTVGVVTVARRKPS